MEVPPEYFETTVTETPAEISITAVNEKQFQRSNSAQSDLVTGYRFGWEYSLENLQNRSKRFFNKHPKTSRALALESITGFLTLKAMGQTMVVKECLKILLDLVDRARPDA